MSVEKCRASASRAWLSYLRAMRPRARERHQSTRHRKQHHGEGGDRGLDIDAAKEEAEHGLVDDPGAGQQQQAGFDEGGKVFDFAVAVLVVGVGGLVGDADRKKGQQRCDQIEPGVRGFGENAEAAGGNADYDLEAGDDDRGQYRVPRGGALLGAHQLRRRKDRGA